MLRQYGAHALEFLKKSVSRRKSREPLEPRSFLNDRAPVVSESFFVNRVTKESTFKTVARRKSLCYQDSHIQGETLLGLLCASPFLHLVAEVMHNAHSSLLNDISLPLRNSRHPQFIHSFLVRVSHRIRLISYHLFYLRANRQV